MIPPHEMRRRSETYEVVMGSGVTGVLKVRPTKILVSRQKDDFLWYAPMERCRTESSNLPTRGIPPPEVSGIFIFPAEVA